MRKKLTVIIVHPKLESAYAEMARDKRREKEAMEWAEITFKDADHEKALGIEEAVKIQLDIR